MKHKFRIPDAHQGPPTSSRLARSMGCNLKRTRTHKQSFSYTISTFTYFFHSRQKGLAITQTLINQPYKHPSCIVHTPCDRVAHRLPRKSRTHPHHPHPQSQVVSSERAALVSLSIYAVMQRNSIAFEFPSYVCASWNCAQRCCGSLSEGLLSHEISHGSLAPSRSHAQNLSIAYIQL